MTQELITQELKIQELVDERFTRYLDRGKLTHHQYQKDGVRWMLTNELRNDPVCNVRGGFIADEMGLGKTIMMIGTMLCNFVERTLIIVPLALVDQWYVQIARTTGHKALIYRKKQISQETLAEAKIVITTYETISLSLKKKVLTPLHRLVWGRIIFDEAHHLRNNNTSLYFGAHIIRANIRWLVSGTPIQNRKNDFYSLCSILRLPASYYSQSENLIELTRAFIIKRTKKQVGINLPELFQKKNIVDWTDKREKELAEELHSVIDCMGVQGKDKKDKGLPFKGILSALLRAKQSCILPRLLSNNRGFSEYKDAFNCSSKLDYAVGKMLERKGNGCGKLIFCHFRKEIDEIATRLRAGGITSVATFDGRINEAQRKTILSEGHEALILQIQTGCEGLNLQEHYSEIYFISPHWNPAVEDQAIARCHRIGQTKIVHVERFEMCGFDDLESLNIEKYTNLTQQGKREVAREYIK
jgi:SNF2 family DNA or RNA helicase